MARLSCKLMVVLLVAPALAASAVAGPVSVPGRAGDAASSCVSVNVSPPDATYDLGCLLMTHPKVRQVVMGSSPLP